VNDILNWEKHRALIVPVLIFLVLLTFAAAFLPPQTVWITDNGNKLMIMHNFAEYGSIFFNHANPENFPFCGFHFQSLADGRITSFHSPYLPVLTAYLYRLAGSTAVVLPSILSLTVICALFFRFPGRKRRYFTFLAATPLIFYALLIWEMLPAACAVTVAAWCFFRKRFTIAGVFFGCGIWMREELYLLGFILMLILFCQRQWRVTMRFAAGAAFPVLALWMTNYLLFNNITGIHGSSYFVNNREGFSLLLWGKEVLFNFYQHLLRFETLPGKFNYFLIAALLPVMIAGAAPGYRRWQLFKYISGGVFTAAAMTAAVFLWREKAYLLVSARTFGLFFSVPILLGYMLNWRQLICDRHRMVSCAAWLTALYMLTIPFLLNPNDIGLTWGARHFIMVLPLMVLLSAYAWGKSGLFRGICGKSIFTGVLLAGIIIQLYGVYALVKVAGDTEYLQNEILTLPHETVLSDVFFLPEMTPLVPAAKLQLEIASPQQMASAMKYLSDSGTNSFILLLSPDYRRISNQELGKLLTRYPPRMRPVPIVIGNSLLVYLTVCSK